MTQAPAGWYPDPTPQPGVASLRYWDGAAWTAHVSPVAPAQVAAPAGPKTPDGEPLAGWWWRALAYMIDGFILSIATSIFTIPAQIEMQTEMQKTMEEFGREIDANPEQTPDFGYFFDEMLGVMQDNAFWLTVPSAIVFVLYFGIFLRWKGATPGKLVLGLRVRLRERPGTLPWTSIGARLVLMAAPSIVLYSGLLGGMLGLLVLGYAAAFLIFMADVLWATWDDQRQTLHDKLASTNVVKTR